MKAVIFTNIYPATETNRLAYEMAAALCLNKDLGIRKNAIERVKYIKEYAQDICPSYDASECYYLGKVKPESREYYSALTSLLSWSTPYQVESFYDWYDSRSSSLTRFLMNPLSFAVVWGLNFVMDMDCTVDEWRAALKLTAVIDLYRLAGYTVQLEIFNKTVSIPSL